MLKSILLFGAIVLVQANHPEYDPPKTDAIYLTGEIPLHCPQVGVYGYAHPKVCDEYFQCTNGTMTHEYCPNGLLFSDNGHVAGLCAYHWNVDCKGREIPKPISSPGCPWQFGFFNEDDRVQCNVFYTECSWGLPERRQCSPAGLFYDERIKGCNWPDQLGCSSESLLNFKCPEEDKGNRFWPYPRYYYNQASIITCVTGQPRLVNCPEGELVDPESLTCVAIHKEEETAAAASGRALVGHHGGRGHRQRFL